MRGAQHVLTILAVADLSVAASFYRTAFGWEERISTPTYVEFFLPGGMRFGVYERNGFARTVGELPERVGEGTISATEVYLHVSDLTAAMESLTRAGGRLLSPRLERPWGDEAAYFADPDGNVVVVACPLAHPGWAER